MPTINQCEKCGYYTIVNVPQERIGGDPSLPNGFCSTNICMQCDADYCLKFEEFIELDGTECDYFKEHDEVEKEAFRELQDSMKSDPFFSVFGLFS